MNREIFKCIVCRKLRGKCEVQKWPTCRHTDSAMNHPSPTLGWMCSDLGMSLHAAESKRWAVLFTCLSVRPIHIEVIESMDSSSLINGLRRFQAIRGPVKHLCSDRGTNFIGASKDLEIPSNADEKAVEISLRQGHHMDF